MTPQLTPPISYLKESVGIFEEISNCQCRVRMFKTSLSTNFIMGTAAQ